MASAPRQRVSPPQPSDAKKGWGMESVNDAAPKAGKPGRPGLLAYSEMPEWCQRESNPFLFIFMFAAVTCLSLSTTYHTLMNHSQHMEHLCLRLDMLGVVIFILDDLVLGIYTTFWCGPLPRYIYWSLVGGFGSMTIFTTLYPKYQGAKYRTFRALMFVATGLCGVAPLIHGIIVFGMSGMMRKAFPYTMAKAVCLLSGTGFYATRFPESSYPGNFDLWGSHSIFHVLVVCAAVVQLMGYLDAYDYAQSSITCSAH